MTDKTAKPARKPATSRGKPATPRRKPATPHRRASTTTLPSPDHTAISERAYYIHLEDGGSDELANWLRAERELTAAA